MTDYDLRTREALRRVVLLEYGFGPETLRGRKICPVCGRAGRADRTHCADCGAPLPGDDPLRLLPFPPPLLPRLRRGGYRGGGLLPGVRRASAGETGGGGMSLFRRREPPKAAVCCTSPAMTRRAADWLRALGAANPSPSSRTTART